VKLMIASSLATALFAGYFQTLSAPPMKMGLWEQTTVVHMKMTGAKLPPGMPTEQTVKSHSCYTPETWANLLSNTGNNKSCTVSNQTIAGSHISLDISCGDRMVLKMHMEGQFTSMESGHGTVHMEGNNPQMNIVSDSTYDTRFISSSCGSVAPGKTEIVP
jgi:hypothetical protein